MHGRRAHIVREIVTKDTQQYVNLPRSSDNSVVVHELAQVSVKLCLRRELIRSSRWPVRDIVGSQVDESLGRGEACLVCHQAK